MLLNELDEELKTKRGLLKRDGDRIFSLLSQLRKGLSFVFEESNYIIKKQRQILKNADIVAKNTVAAAEDKAKHCVANTEIMQLAQIEAKNLLNTTSAKCDLLINKTKEHLDVLFADTEQFLISTLSTIRVNRSELREAMLIKK